MTSAVAVQPLLFEECQRVESEGATRFQFRLSRREFRQLLAAALAKGVTPSELVREQLYAVKVLVLTDGTPDDVADDDDESDEEIERKFQQALRQAKARTARESVDA